MCASLIKWLFVFNVIQELVNEGGSSYGAYGVGDSVEYL